MDQCNKCGSPLDPNLPQSLCPTCGFQIIDISMQIIHQEPPKEGFPLTIAKAKAFVMQKVYDFNFWRAIKTPNLTLARNLLERDSILLRSIPLLYSSESEAILTAQMQETAQKIRSRSGELETTVQDITSLFEQKDFVSTRLKCKQLLPEIRQQGLTKWAESLQVLRKKAHANILILRELQKCPIPIVPESPSESILIQNAILASLDEKMSNLIHNETVSLVKSVKTAYITELENRKITIPSYGFMTKLITNVKTIPTKLKDIFTNARFMLYTNGGLKWQNLPKAWNILQKAQKLADDPHNMIFFDYKAEFDQIITETREKIANLTEEAEKYLDETLATMNQFKFDEATAQLQSFIKTLQTYKMEVLADQMQGQIALVELSKALLAEVQEIEAINEKKDSLTAQKSLFELKTRIEKEIGFDKVISSLAVKITTLEEAINRVRTQGEAELLTQVEMNWKTLQDQLNFEEIERIIYQQRTFAEQQEFQGAINRINQILGDLGQNKSIYTQYLQLQESVKQETYKTAKEGLADIFKTFDKKSSAYFSQLESVCHDLDNEIDKKIGATDQNLKKEFEKAKKDLEDQLDFFHVAEDLNRIELRATAAGLTAYSPFIKETTERLVFNQKIQTEIVAHEKKLQEGRISETQTAIDQLVKDVSKHEKAYIPKLVEHFNQFKDAVEEVIEN